MAQELVVKEPLTQEMIEAGDGLTRSLDKTHLFPDASLWFYIPENNAWRLIIASREVKIEGPRKVYRKIQSVLNKMKTDNKPALGLSDIGVVETTSPLISVLRAAKKTGTGMTEIRVTKNTINGYLIDDAYIYRLP